MCRKDNFPLIIQSERKKKEKRKEHLFSVPLNGKQAVV